MDPTFITLSSVFGILVAVILGGSIWDSRRESKRNKLRNEAINDWSQSAGLRFRSSVDYGMSNRYSFRCLQQGEQRYAYNIMEGYINKRKVCAFDYHYAIRKQRGGYQHHCISAVIVETTMPLKPLIISSENRKWGRYLGYSDIDFESSEFNKTFFVNSSDRKWAYDVINQKNMELLLNSSHFDIELNGNAVLATRYAWDGTFAAGYFPEAAQLLTGIVDNLPESLSDEKKVERK